MGVTSTITIKRGEFDMRGYDVVRAQFFTSASMISASFSPRGIRFSSACIRKFVNTEYIDLQIDPNNLTVAAVPCPDDYKDKLLWARVYADGISVRNISASAFLDTLYEIFGWDMGKRYRLRGDVFGSGGNTYALFDTKTPEIFTSRYEMTMPWATGFGENYYRYRESQIRGAMTCHAFSEYNNDPGLQPTTPEAADDHIRLLVEKMQNEGRSSDAGTDILC